MNLKIKREEAENFLIFMLFGAALYYHVIAGNTPCPDAIWNGLFTKNSWEWEASLGRVFLRYWQSIFSWTASAPIMTEISIGLYSISALLLIRLFEIKGRFWQILTGILVVIAVPSTWCTLTFYFCSAYYAGAYLMMIAGFYILERSKCHAVIRYVAAILLIVLSLGTYQAYLPLWMTLAVLWSIKLFSEEKSVIKIIIGVVDKIVCAAAGTGVYLIMVKILQSKWGIVPESSRGFDHIGEVGGAALPAQIGKCYFYFASYFLGTSFVNNGAPIKRAIINAAVLTVIVLLLVFWLIKGKQKIVRKAGVVIAILLLPLVMMSVVILAPGASVLGSTGALMLPTMGYVFLLLVMLVGMTDSGKEDVDKEVQIGILDRIRSGLKLFSSVALFFSMVMLIQLAVDGQTYMYANLLKTTAVAEEMRTDLDREFGDVNSQKVMITGTMETGNYPDRYEGLHERVSWTVASYGMIWKDFSSAQNIWNQIFVQYLGSGFKKCSMDEYESIKETEEFKSMSDFPNEGSIKKIGDIIVVRLSDRY